MKKILLPLFFLCLFIFTKCATIVSKSKYPFSITTNPAGAQVTITNSDGLNVFSGSTPSSVILKSGNGYFRNATYVIKINKEGYEEKIITVSSSFNGWYIGNLVFGGALGMLIVDPLTGAMYKFRNPFISETLVQKSSSINRELEILDYNSIPQEWKSNLERVN